MTIFTLEYPNALTKRGVMKPAAGVVILSSLVSLTTADALLAKDVPVGCATICGPVVDLSSKCTPLQSGNSEADSEANEGGNVWVGRRRADAPGVEDEPWEIYDDEELDRRFFTIQPAPTSFAPEFASLLDPNSVHVTTQQPPRPTRITPVIVASSSQPLSLPPTKAAPAVAAPLGSSTSSSEQEEISQAVPTPSPTSTTAIQGSKTAQSSMSLAKSPVSSTNGEVQCVCLNKSFNVPRVAALCTSCILQAGDANTIMNNVMSVCNFSGLHYTPGDDASVNNVQVSATRPSTVWGHVAGVSNSNTGASRRAGEACMAMFGFGLMWMALGVFVYV